MANRAPEGLVRGLTGKQVCIVCVLLAAAVVLVFGQTIRHDFVNYDDDEYFYANPHIQQGLTLRSVAWAFQTTYAGNWFPLTWLSLMLDVSLFGSGPAAPHFMNVLLHAGNTILLFLLLDRLTGAWWRSALVAGLFGLHPLHVESVAWVTERKDVLSTCFGFLALLMYGRYVQSRGQPLRSRAYWLAVVFFALGLMSKPMLVTWPLVMMLLDDWPLGRQVSWKDKLPFFALAAVSSGVTVWAQRSGGALESLARLPVEIRAANALVAYVGYIQKTFWPVELAAFYPLRANLPATTVAGSVAVLVVVTALVIGRRHQAPWLLTGWLWYLTTLLPVIGLVQVGAQAMADRYTYVPLIGLFIIACWSLPARRIVVAPAAVVVLGVCATLSWVQVGHWKDTETLFRHALRVTRGNWLAHYNLATHASATGRVQDAIAHYQQALSIEPEFAEAHNNLGVLLTQEGRLDEAIGHLERALQIKPDSVEAHNNLGVALTHAGRIEESVLHYRTALRLKPGYAQAAYNWGRSCVLLGRLSEAIQHWQQALRIQPDYAEAHYDLGVALAASGRLPEAIEHWQQAVRINPDFAEAHYNLAVASEHAGKTTEAIRHCEEALRVRPDYAEARIRLERLRAAQQ